MGRYLKFLLLAMAASTQQEASEPAEKCVATVPTKEEFTEEMLKLYCENSSFIATNKPNFAIGMQEGKAMPLSCFTNQTKCKRQTEMWKGYFQLPYMRIKDIELNDYRVKNAKKFTAFAEEFLNKLSPLVKKLPSSYLNNINELYLQLVFLKELYIGAQIVEQRQLGNCGEQTGHAAINLLRLIQKYDLNLQLHYMLFNNTEESSGFVGNHGCLVTNSKNAKNIEINNKQETKKYLKLLKESKDSAEICDPWNAGKRGKLSDDKSNLYDHHGPWDAVETKKVHFNFKMLRSLPVSSVKKAFCDELESMGLSEEPQQTFMKLNIFVVWVGQKGVPGNAGGPCFFPTLQHTGMTNIIYLYPHPHLYYHLLPTFAGLDAV